MEHRVEQAPEQEQAPKLCAKGCGFYGGLCGAVGAGWGLLPALQPLLAWPPGPAPPG